MHFIARRAELEAIGRLSTSANGGAIVFTGEHGLGKTRLLQQAAAVSPVRAVLVPTNPAEATWPLSGFSAVFAAIDDPRAVEFAGRFTLRSSDPQLVFAASRDLLTMLRGLELSPVTILIDDLDRMDEVSQTLIGFMAGRLAGTGLRFVATAHELDGDHMLAFREQPLAPLSPDETSELVGAELGVGADPGTVRILAARSGGNPLVIAQSAASLTREQSLGREAMILPMRPAEALKDTTAVQLDRMSPAARQMADDIAMAASSEVGVLVGDDVARVDALEELLSSATVELRGQTVRLGDPLLRSHLYWGLDPHRRRDRHRELAELCTPADPRGAVWHESFDLDGRPAVPGLLDAAHAFAEEGDVQAAVEYAERAVLLDPDLSAHHREMLRFASALTAQGELDLAAHYLRHVRFVRPSAMLALQLASARIGVDMERTQLVPTDDVEASVSLHGDDDPAGAADLLSTVAAFHSMRWDIDEARKWLRLAGLFVPKTAAGTSLAYDDAARMIEAIDGGSPYRPGTKRHSSDELKQLSPSSLISFGTALCFQERYAQARRVVNVVLHSHPGEHLARAWAWNLSLINEIRAGDFHRGHAVVQNWLAEPDEADRHHATRALAVTWHELTLGHDDEARELAEECTTLASAERNPAVLARLDTFLGSVALMKRDLDEAVRLLSLADAISIHIANPSLVRHLPSLIEACAASDRRAEAETALQRLIDQQERRPSTWLDIGIARSRAILARDDDAPSLFADALADYSDVSNPYETGRTLLAQGDRLMSLGLTTDGESALAAAAAAFERAGASQWARRASSNEPVAAPDPASILALLKDEERTIAELVRRGMRNREIAGELYISLRTVELRLTHIYRKVGARSRSHLTSLLN